MDALSPQTDSWQVIEIGLSILEHLDARGIMRLA